MQGIGSSTTRIAKNTVALYIRSFIVLFVSLYTSRVILQVLGVEDLGVYNVVGGMVVMFAFLDGSQNQTYQRYYNYAMGRPDQYSLRDVFNAAINVQVIIASVVLVLTEVIGLYLLNNRLVIPEGRMTAAFWVFQLSTATLVINTLSIPYSALIVAHENLRAFAYIDIVNVILKLLVVFTIQFLHFDRLILYAILLFCVQLITRLAYTSFCHRKHPNIRYILQWNGRLTKDMAGFSGWIVLSSIVSMLFSQGISILYNMFYGVVVNAAIGIGNQVRGAILKLTNNLTMSLGPQLVTNYAKEDWGKVEKIWTIGNKCAVTLFAAFAIPVIIDADYILELWLKQPPQYSTIFLRLILIENLIRFFSAVAPSVVRASGRIKVFELVTNAINILSLIVIYLGFHFIDSISLPYYILMINSTAQVFYSIWLASRRIHYSFVKYILQNTVLLLLAMSIPSLLGVLLAPKVYTVWLLLAHCTLTALLVLISLYFIGLVPSERLYINETIIKLIRKKWKQ